MTQTGHLEKPCLLRAHRSPPWVGGIVQSCMLRYPGARATF